MFSTKTLCQMFFQTCLKDFKLKKLVVEPYEEPIDPQLNWSRVQKKFLFLPERLFNRSRLRSGRGPTITYQTLNAND